MAKKSINDPDFFDDAHLDEVGEPVAILDPDGGSGDDGADAEPVAADDDAAADDADAGVVVDETADAEAVDDVVADEERDPAPHLNDLETAKLAYAEVRKWANQRDMEARKNAERIAQLEADLTEFDYEEPAPAYDARRFAQEAGEDPRAAFEYAISNGQTADAQAAIAQVQADSAELAALAAHAMREGDQQAYQQHRSQATNAAALAMQLEGRLSSESLRAQQAPLVQAYQQQNVATAWNTLNQQTNGDLGARRAQIQQVLAERPYLVQGSTAEAIHRGYRDAYDIARSMPAPDATPTAGSIDDVVKSAVDKHIAATRAAKAKAATAAGGADSGRTGPAATPEGDTTKSELYAAARTASMGARKFMDE